MERIRIRQSCQYKMQNYKVKYTEPRQPCIGSLQCCFPSWSEQPRISALYVVCIWVGVSCVSVSAFFFFFFTRFLPTCGYCSFDQYSVNSTSVYCSRTHKFHFFINFFIKNESHGTMYTFKNYFAIVISAINFQFQQNKSYPNRPVISV